VCAARHVYEKKPNTITASLRRSNRNHSPSSETPYEFSGELRCGTHRGKPLVDHDRQPPA
jgi:hypothetical protein